MFVAQWMYFTDSYRGSFSGYGCEVLAERAEGSRLLIRIDDAGTLDVAADRVGDRTVDQLVLSQVDAADRYHNSMAWGR
jgi:hypothetical protein